MRRALSVAACGALFLSLGIPPAAAASPLQSSMASGAYAPRSGAPLPGDLYPGTGSEKVKVMVLLKQQPTGIGNEADGLSAVDRLVARHQGVDVDRRFGMLVNGFSAWMTTAEAAAVATDPDVASVSRVKQFYPTMQTAAELTQSVQARQQYGVDGAGLVVSIIDTGIDIKHQDMQLDPGAKTKIAPAAGFTAKVPYGYNFADRNTTVKDTTSSQHGMHVSGIVAANGGPSADVATNGRIHGIAPNAQLLAMKVFSNDESHGHSCYEDDVVAAIEDSVKHGADVINMSLGSANGLNETAQGEGRAILNA